MGHRGDPVKGLPLLSPATLPGLPVTGPAYDRRAITPGIAHIGVGAFHRVHQAEYTDDLLAMRPGAWGIVGVNIRPPLLADTLGAQAGLYTRLSLRDAHAEARVIGSILRLVDSQDRAEPALAVLADPAIHVVTMTVTEKGYCHRPADGRPDLDNPALRHDLAHPQAPRSLPGLLLQALRLRAANDAPVTLISCDNIPSNGAILRTVVGALADRRDPGLARWIDANVAFPATMVDRIAPATTAADIARVARDHGYHDDAVVVAEPFRQWVIEDRFAGPRPDWAGVGALLVADVAPFEILKMRLLNGAQTALAHLGALCGLEHTSDDIADPLLAAFVHRMLAAETLPTLRPVPGIDTLAYLAQSLDRLTNTAIRHRNHQIATDGSQKIVQRLLDPLAERLDRGAPAPLLTAAVAGWMAYLLAAAPRFGARWTADDPYASRIAAIGQRNGPDASAVVAAILALDGIFAPRFAADAGLLARLADAVRAFLTADPRHYLRALLAETATEG